MTHDKLGVPSYLDTHRVYIVTAEDPFTSFLYAGAAAQYALCLKKAGAEDPEGIDWLKEAVETYEWGNKNLLPGDENKKPNGTSLYNARGYASASIFVLTGEKKYEDMFVQDMGSVNFNAPMREFTIYAPAMYALFGGSKSTNKKMYQAAYHGCILSADSLVYPSFQARATRWAG
ncbi:MAG: hypothetical protein HC896_04075, partial [Bacteroidales bacterium]|nr:hypothetical protein [Bacteroidales bacterium]